MTIRSFLAFPISGILQEKLEQIIQALQTSCADVKWVSPKNIHLTLKFLGEVPQEDLKTISSLVRERCSGFHPVNSYLSGIGAFPDLRFPKIIWAALNDPNKEIQAMADALQEDLGKIGLPKEDRPFKAHLTLGRLKSQVHIKNLLSTLQQMDVVDKTQETLDRVILYKSTLTTQGPIYEALEEFKITRGC